MSAARLSRWLLDANQSVRVLTRDANKVAHWGDKVQIAVGSFDQPETLLAAMQGAEQLFLMTAELGANNVENAIQAATRAGVRQVVYLSSTGANDPTLLLGKWHVDREAIIRASGLAWTFLRPGYFMSNTLMWAETIKTQGSVYFPGGEGKVAPIAPEDIAAVAALALTQPGHDSQIYELTGDTLLRTADIVEILSRVLGKPLRYVDISPEAAREGMLKSGMPSLLADAVIEVFNRLREGHGEQTADTVEKLTGRKPVSFEAWCRTHVAAFQ